MTEEQKIRIKASIKQTIRIVNKLKSLNEFHEDKKLIIKYENHIEYLNNLMKA